MPRRPPHDDDPPRLVLLPGRGRPEAPKDLTAVEQRIWRALVDSSPDRWFDAGAQELLGLVVLQIAAAKEHAARYRRLRAKGGSIEDELMILKAHKDALRAAQSGMSALRITPAARMRPGSASAAHAASPGGPKPWETEAGTIEGAVIDGDDDGAA